MKKILITMILLVAFTQIAAADTLPILSDGNITWNHVNGAVQNETMLDCSDYDPVLEDGYIHWVVAPDANFTDAYIQVGDDGDWFQMDTSKVSGGMRHFYSEPYYTDEELADMNVTVEYNGTASYKTKITLSHYCPGGGITEVPEFPTLAVPIAAIIGLAFLMQRRKE